MPAAIVAGKLTDQAAAIGRLVVVGTLGVRSSQIGFELAGPATVAWTEDESTAAQRGTGFLSRQTSCIAGGTTEMARNVISERVLGMARERTPDRELPFREVAKGPPAK